jgi:hypothetical protein
MKLHIPLCPTCGAPARGTVERLCGVAEFGKEPALDSDRVLRRVDDLVV